MPTPSTKYVLLPGLEGTGDLFREFVARRPEGIDTQVFCYPGAVPGGYSGYADVVLEALQEEGDYLLVAESFSGPVGIVVAAQSPPGLRGLVLCNTFAAPPSWSGFARLPWTLLMSGDVPRFTAGCHLVGFDRVDGWIDEIRAANRKVDPAVRAQRMKLALTTDVREALARVGVPILVLRGTRDRLVWKGSFRRILRCRPDVRVAEIEGPHLLLQIEPGACWAAITKFAAGIR